MAVATFQGVGTLGLSPCLEGAATARATRFSTLWRCCSVRNPSFSSSCCSICRSGRPRSSPSLLLSPSLEGAPTSRGGDLATRWRCCSVGHPSSSSCCICRSNGPMSSPCLEGATTARGKDFLTHWRCYSVGNPSFSSCIFRSNGATLSLPLVPFSPCLQGAPTARGSNFSTHWRCCSVRNPSSSSCCCICRSNGTKSSRPLRASSTSRKKNDRFALLRAPEIATAPPASSSSKPGGPSHVRPSPAEGRTIFDIFFDGLLSVVLAVLRMQEARLFGPYMFNASKLRVLLPGKDDEERPLQHPRIYTLTHNDITANITLAVAREINKAQIMGWYSQMQRDEVVAEWRRMQGEMLLQVHCHISGSNFFHSLMAKLRFYIFQKELPLVLAAFMYGDKDLFKKHPELQKAPVWVYFHSNVDDYNRVECWGPLIDATMRGVQSQKLGASNNVPNSEVKTEGQFLGADICVIPCECCSQHATVIPIPESLNRHLLQTQAVPTQQPSMRKETAKSSFRLC